MKSQKGLMSRKTNQPIVLGLSKPLLNTIPIVNEINDFVNLIRLIDLNILFSNCCGLVKVPEKRHELGIT